jgi:hypothetical protein
LGSFGIFSPFWNATSGNPGFHQRKPASTVAKQWAICFHFYPIAEKRPKNFFPHCSLLAKLGFLCNGNSKKIFFFFLATKKCPTNKRRFLWVQFLITLLFNISESCNLVNHHWTRQTVKSVKKVTIFCGPFPVSWKDDFVDNYFLRQKTG